MTVLFLLSSSKECGEGLSQSPDFGLQIVLCDDQRVHRPSSGARCLEDNLAPES
jgi:hypothetical protein